MRKFLPIAVLSAIMLGCLTPAFAFEDRSYNHSYKQTEINRYQIKKAEKYDQKRKQIAKIEAKRHQQYLKHKHMVQKHNNYNVPPRPIVPQNNYIFSLF